MLVQYLIAPAGRGVFAARRAPGAGCSRVYLPGGAIGSAESLESVCARQGWKITRGQKVYEKKADDGKHLEWFYGRAIMTGAGASLGARVATQAQLERCDFTHEDAFDFLESLKTGVSGNGTI